MKSEEMLQNPYGYTFIDIISYLNAKLPIPMQRVYGVANRCTSHAQLEDILCGYARPKTALNMKQVSGGRNSYLPANFQTSLEF